MQNRLIRYKPRVGLRAWRRPKAWAGLGYLVLFLAPACELFDHLPEAVLALLTALAAIRDPLVAPTIFTVLDPAAGLPRRRR